MKLLNDKQNRAIEREDTINHPEDLKEIQRLLLFLMLGIEIKRRKMKVHSYLPEFVSPRISKGCISCVRWSKHWQNMTLSMP